ncbi:MAG: endoplasmic oxidoreductin-1 [Trizodia sp. TS-e1964]|nr:MAG: endoplasmic oxidoreductin-1 [Trizodia sp. TS-e1964]
MRNGARGFYLAVFALLGTCHVEGKDPTKSRDSGPDVCIIEPTAIVSDACVSYSTLDSLNSELSPFLKSITQTTDFFAYYRLNLYNRVCPFWNDANSMCGNIACAVNTINNESDIPAIWRAEELGKLRGPSAEHPGRKLQKERQERPLQGELGEDVRESCVVEYDDECDERDYCVLEDERASAKGDYVSLVDNPERFTGYSGPGARQVWDSIYKENCFSKPGATKPKPLVGTAPFGSVFARQAENDLKNVFKGYGRQQAFVRQLEVGSSDDDLLQFDDECLEKRVFHRIISGMHASISTHLCWDYLNQTTGKWGPNLQCYEERLHKHPERISNLYFNYAVVLRSVAKLRSHIAGYTFCSGDAVQDRTTKRKVLKLADKIVTGPQIFNEHLMFQDPTDIYLKEDFRNRFRNVSRLMDCVGCDKCRLWGKLQTAGYGTALKVLFEFQEGSTSVEAKNPPLQRTELVALVNTLDRISNSLIAVENFRILLKARDERRPLTEVENRRMFGETPKRPVNTSENATVDLEDDFDDPFSETPTHEPSIKEVFWQEFDLIWRTWRYVIKSWLGLPNLVWNIFLGESGRLWDWFLGIPEQPRAWEVKWPTHEDL